MYKGNCLTYTHIHDNTHAQFSHYHPVSSVNAVRDELHHPTMKGATMMHERQCFYYRMGGS